METSNLKNMVVLKNLPSNIVDEAIIVLKTNKKAKKLQKIEKNNKTTYVTLYGMEKAEADVQSMSDEALDIIKSVGKNEFLEEIVLNLIHRNK